MGPLAAESAPTGVIEDVDVVTLEVEELELDEVVGPDVQLEQ